MFDDAKLSLSLGKQIVLYYRRFVYFECEDFYLPL